MFLKISAQEYEGIAKGDKEITFNGMVITMEGLTMGNIFISGGYYITDKLLLGLAPGLTLGKDVTDFSGQLFANYNFSSSKPTFPYVKASYYQQSFDTKGYDSFFDLSFIQAGVGYKVFFNAKVNWDTSLTYGFSPAGNVGFGMLMLLTGISVKW